MTSSQLCYLASPAVDLAATPLFGNQLANSSKRPSDNLEP